MNCDAVLGCCVCVQRKKVWLDCLFFVCGCGCEIMIAMRSILKMIFLLRVLATTLVRKAGF
jgi:hypothetical protein